MSAVIQGRGIAEAEREYEGRFSGLWWVSMGVPGFWNGGTFAVVDDFGNLVRVSV